MRYPFTPDLATGNSIIDEEHKALLKAVDKVMQDISSGKGKENAKESIVFLLDYTKTHFAHEQELQVKSNYPDYATHKAWHTQFLADIQKKATTITAGNIDSVFVIELTKTITNLVNHIKTFDKKLADYLKTAK